MFTRMPDCDPKWSSNTGTLCTNGEWPCEMSTTLASLEAENERLKIRVIRLKEALRTISEIRPSCSTSGYVDLFFGVPICDIMIDIAAQVLKEE